MIRQRHPIPRESEKHKARRLAEGCTPRTTRPLRKTPIAKATKPIKAKKRKPSEYARIYHSKARVLWVKAQRCIACHRQAEDGHHITVDGMSRKASYDQIVPLCRSHHSAIHHHGPVTFAALVNVDLVACAADTERRWQAHLIGSSNGATE